MEALRCLRCLYAPRPHYLRVSQTSSCCAGTRPNHRTPLATHDSYLEHDAPCAPSLACSSSPPSKILLTFVSKLTVKLVRNIRRENLLTYPHCCLPS
ncbi:hypothetical protein GMOD_00000066 [Pyrenophora seminiperda CCB06]|uniref:Uncharacterized protein n=1 Tax=Pyrenophora seminiperda CCB06 TaxID=1302712 RepID=A0A3M7M6A6_9PLEO|nr:hypothetical protein GMOD_00000066 [Pyrenophora seminiperda CCB06]